MCAGFIEGYPDCMEFNGFESYGDLSSVALFLWGDVMVFDA